MKYNIKTSEKVVWIHDQDGQCVARFGKYGGEILTKLGYVVKIKAPIWDRWKKDAEKEFGIEIPDEAKPK